MIDFEWQELFFGRDGPKYTEYRRKHTYFSQQGSFFEVRFSMRTSRIHQLYILAILSMFVQCRQTSYNPGAQSSKSLGTTVYYIFRSFFNLLRSYDPLLMASVFAFWLSFGAFPGAIALMVVTIASLGKLFSEAIENIDAGPIEALHATGANPLQTVIYGVVPQIVPDFISFIIYHWDINVRISTIIGFVGGGGIGFYLSEQINGSHYDRAGTAIWAIVIVVRAMNFLSAEIRKRLT